MKKLLLVVVFLLLVIPHQVQATCEPNIPADVTGDCKVDFNDFAILAADWLQSSDMEAETKWIDRYNGPGNGTDGAYAIVIDSNDNIYVAGYSFVSGTDYDYTTIKYAPDSSQPVWVARYSGPGNEPDQAEAIAVDSNGNVYVTGGSYGSGTDYDYATVKYSPDSNQPVWVARYNGPGNASDVAYAIAVDSIGNVYVTGRSYGSDERDYATIKYSADSNQPVWVARYNGPGNGWDTARAIAVDSNDNVYVTGGSYSSATHYDYTTIKYAPDSNQPVWVARYNGPPGNGSDEAFAIAVDSNDNVYVTGISYGSSASDYATVKYSPDSNQPVWVARYNGPLNYAYAIAVDSNDNVYVTGWSYDDYATIKYSPDSNQPVWVARYEGPGNDWDHAEAIAVDGKDNIYVTGYSYGSGTDYDYTTIKYSPDSNQPVWVARYNGPGNSSDHAEAIAIDSNDNIYVAGWSYGSNNKSDFTTIKYSPDYICTPESVGDFNHDCKVDIKDLAIFCQRWLECNLDPPEACWE